MPDLGIPQLRAPYTYLIFKLGSIYYAADYQGKIVTQNADAGVVLNSVNALLVDGDTVAFKGGLTYSGSTQYLNATRKRITYNGNGAVISGFMFKLNGKPAGTAQLVDMSVFRGFRFSGASAGIVLDNAFAQTVEHCNFDTCAVGISVESSANWSELWKISNCHFNDCTKSIVFKTPTGAGTGSYINGTLEHCTFNSDVIGTAYTFIEVQASAEIAETRLYNSRFWFNAAGVVGTGISIAGNAARFILLKPYFENFATATNTVGITIATTCTAGPYFLGRPVFAGAGTWTSKISNAFDKYIYGPVGSWRESAAVTPSATINTYGSAVTILSGQTNADWGGIPNIYVAIGGTVGGSETVTVEITLVRYYSTNVTVTKTYNSTGTFPLNLADYIALLSNNLWFVADSFSVRAKSSIASTIATVTFGGFEGGTIAPSDITNFQDYSKITAPNSPTIEVGRVYFRTIDANNNGLFIKVKKAGAIVEVQIA